MSDVKIFQNSSELNHYAAEKFVEIGNRAIKENGSFTVALAGGSTPKSLYQLLTTEEYKSRIDWGKVFFFFGDERNVPPEDGESNFRMANENLLEPLQIQEKNIFRWQTEIEEAKKIAENYEKKIREFFDLSEGKLPRFDLILLGMGADGHTASLFPETEALSETKKLAVANAVKKFDSFRLTLSFPVINNAANVIFLITGNEKAETLKTIFEGELQPEKFPAQRVAPENGNLFWLVEKSAARFLNN